MIVKDIMSTNIKTAKPDTSVREIAKIMCFNKISGMPVVDDDGKIVGVVSEKDVLHSMFPDIAELSEQGSYPDFEEMEGAYESTLSNQVENIMTKAVATVPPDIPILKAASLMWLRKIRRIPVAENGVLVGIISIGDVHKAVFQSTLG
ncbi:MAG TPA: CBS domain-containing protein [Chromatiales bacterium]|nr:CBS domain-containing protein [Thiotrichales bacterium]HIP69227.1 CBS domain-containing protein [Chromatiales bacterium]